MQMETSAFGGSNVQFSTWKYKQNDIKTQIM